MTVCPYGPQAKAGSPTWDYFTDANISSALSGLAGFLTTWVINLPVVPFNVADFCASEPPTDLPTTADYAKLFFPPLALISGTYTRFKNQVLNWKFNQLCECAPAPGGTCTNLLTHPVAAGSGTTTLPTGYYVCQDMTPSVNLKVWGVWMFWNLIGSGTAKFFVRAHNSSTDLFSQALTPVTGDHLYNISAPPSLAAGTQYDVGVEWSGSGWQWRENAGSCTPSTTSQCAYGTNRYNNVGVFPPGTRSTCIMMDPQVCLDTSAGPGGSSFPAPPALSPPSGFPSVPAAPTCSTNQDVCNALNAISQKLDWMRLQVDLIQRQGVPFGYVLGTLHSGLTGTGSLTVQDTLGAIVNLTTVPSTWGKSSDNPRRYIPAPASIAIGTVDGLQDTNWVNLPTELIMPTGQGVATRIYYRFAPGVTGSIQEVNREP